MIDTAPPDSSLRSRTVGMVVLLSGRVPAERDLAEGQDDEQAEQGDRRADEEDGVERVGDLGGAGALQALGAGAEPGREHRAEERDADRAAERAEQVRR